MKNNKIREIKKIVYITLLILSVYCQFSETSIFKIEKTIFFQKRKINKSEWIKNKHIESVFQMSSLFFNRINIICNL